MTTTEIMWTALPNGSTKSGALRLSIYVSPRLTGSGPTGLLQDYDLGNWPNVVAALAANRDAFRVDLGTPGSPTPGPLLPLLVDPNYAASLSPALWDAVFPIDRTTVEPRQFQDQSKRWIRSYSVRPVEQYIHALYNFIASSSPTTFPDLKAVTPVTQLTTVMGRGMDIMRKVLPGPRQPGEPKRYQTLEQGQRATHPDIGVETSLTDLAASLGAAEIPLAEMFRAYRFFRRGNDLPYMSKPNPLNPALISAPPTAPLFDFHQAMAALGDHPFLLRKLGLIIDCILPVPAEDLLNYGKLEIVVLPRPPQGDITPWTLYVLDPLIGFRPRPRPRGDLEHGMLALDSKGSPFDLIQTDPDGNVIKVMDYAVNMNKVRADLLGQAAKNPEAKSSSEPAETSLPALRSGGLMITRMGRDDRLYDRLVAQGDYESDPEDSELFADDVLRGYRVDVRYQGDWFSVCRRNGTYEVAGNEFDSPPIDEGYVKADSASSDPDPGAGPQKPDLYVHEALINWHNWSLVARQPGKTIVPEHMSDGRQVEKVEPVDNTPGAGFDVASNFRPERLSLPPLRFGREYAVRMRAVDLAGNSLAPPPSKLDPTPNGDLQAPPGVGESNTLVYRRFDPIPAPVLVMVSTRSLGESVQTMVIRSRSTYGVPMGGSPDPLPAVLGIDETALFNQTDLRWVAPPKSSVGNAEAHRVFDALFTTPSVAFDVLKRESGTFDDYVLGETKLIGADGSELSFPPNPAYQKGDALPAGSYIIHTEDPVALPYLPDPLSHGVALMPQDGSDAVLHQPFAPLTTGASWPDDAVPFKLLLSPAASSAPNYVLGGSPANIQMPIGTMLDIRYASAAVEPGASDPGDLDLMGRWHGMTPSGQAATQAHGYQHWMLTPWRKLTVIHAVEKPLAEPLLKTITLPRQPADTFVEIARALFQLHSPSSGEVELRGSWTDFIDDPLDETGPHTLDKDGHVVDRKIDYGEDNVLIPLNSNVDQPRHEFGDTKHRFVDYYGIATTRYREYFPASLIDYVDPTTKKKLITVEGPKLERNVLSSARPEAPDVLYIVPTFKWIDTADGRQRQGRGLRIYIGRGWYSSGEGELLGIALFPPGLMLETVAEQFREYVSLWGSDPIFDKAPPGVLDASRFTFDPAFPDSAPVTPEGTGILLAEKDLRVDVLGFKPQFDYKRLLWYVDVELLPTNAYNTFIRFGLCRYQPDSLPDLEISKIVRAEFAQLMADRTASLSFGTNAINITVSGPSALSKLGHRWNGDSTDFTVIAQTAPVTTGASAPSAPSATLAAALPPSQQPPPVVLPPPLLSNPAAGSAHLVVAQIEWRLKSSTSDLDWNPLDSGVRLNPFTTLGTTDFVYWEGVVRWPRPGTPKNRDYRLVLREYEIFQTDIDVAENISVTDPNGVPIRSRLVYVDIFPLATS